MCLQADDSVKAEATVIRIAAYGVQRRYVLMDERGRRASARACCSVVAQSESAAQAANAVTADIRPGHESIKPKHTVGCDHVE